MSKSNTEDLVRMCRMWQFSIDRGGTFTDIWAREARTGEVRVLKLLSADPTHYADAAAEGIRRILHPVVTHTPHTLIHSSCHLVLLDSRFKHRNVGASIFVENNREFIWCIGEHRRGIRGVDPSTPST